MKLTTEPGVLAGAVRFAARALTARAAYPILGGLKITAGSDGTVAVSAFDYETSAQARTEAEVSEPGTVLAPGRLLAEITARLASRSAWPRTAQPWPWPAAAPAAVGHLSRSARAARPGRARRPGRVRRCRAPGRDRRLPRRHPARPRRRATHFHRRRGD